MATLTRRAALTAAAAVSAGALLGPAAKASDSPSSSPHDPHPDVFTLGVASGDPSPDGFVLWTRLAPQPLAEDGSGGMPARDEHVRYEIAHDEHFHRVVRRGTSVAPHHLGHSVHVEIAGLTPDRDYWYRFRYRNELSPAGHTRTTPSSDSSTPLNLAVASCANYEHGYYTAYRRIAEENPDMVLFVGDYIYEFKKHPTDNPRHHLSPEPTDLPGYRHRYGLYKSDVDLQAAHAAAPWVPIWDDHEVDDAYAGLVPKAPDVHFAERRAAAYQAYYENLPLRRTSVPHGPYAQLYRRLEWGRVAALHLLDTRQYRDNQACGGGWRGGCGDADAHDRSILGDVHCHNASDVHSDPTDPDTPIVATELVTTSVTSEGDGRDADTPSGEMPVAGNPWLKYRDYRRGYIMAHVSTTQTDVEFKILPYVSTPGAAVETRRRYVIEAGRPGLVDP